MRIPDRLLGQVDRERTRAVLQGVTPMGEGIMLTEFCSYSSVATVCSY